MTYEEYLDNKRAYQEEGYLFLLEVKHGCLFFKPGKGKTYPCIDAVRDVDKSLNGNAKVLVLSTADAIKNMWNVEIVPQNIMPKNTVMMSFSSAIVDKTRQDLLKVNWDILVVDECHKVKAHNTKTSKVVYQLARKTPYVFGLSGTPRGNSDVDIYCQFHNLCVSEWGKIGYTQFVNQCCDIDKKYFGGRVVATPIGVTEKYRGGWNANIAKYTRRADYTPEDSMPPLNVEIVDIPYTATKEYLLAEQGVIKIPDYETTMTKLTAINKLHQAVNGYLYYYDDDGSRKTYFIEHNKKLDWLKEDILIHEEPITVVYRFEQDFEDICKMLDDEHISWTEDVDTFKAGKTHVLLLQCSRCESFNLQMCKRLIFYTLDYSYIKFNQMMHRVWRMGQEKDVDIVILLFKDTVETKIWSAVSSKKKLADLFMQIKGDYNG